MNPPIRSVCWEAPEHQHVVRTADWYWIVGIFGSALAVASIIFGNVLFGIIIILAVTVLIFHGNKPPRIIFFEVSVRGVRMGDHLYPYPSIESFYIDEDSPYGPQLLIKPNKMFSQLLILPLPEGCIDDVDTLLSERIPEEHLREPLSHIVLEYLGF
ncbi:MAG TPA: hypothetical protein VFV22_03080 [Candidatus Paceibacterota bacterium]|nr:hypothetical protein [Candidatus Paceibacterota bacterium]